MTGGGVRAERERVVAEMRMVLEQLRETVEVPRDDRHRPKKKIQLSFARRTGKHRA